MSMGGWDPFQGSYGGDPYAGISGYNPSYVSGQNSLASTQAQIAYQQALTQNQSDQLAFQRAQAAFTDAMSLGSAYGYSMGGNPYNFGSMQLPPAGTPLQSTMNTLGYGGAIPGMTGYNTGETAAYQQQLAAMAAQSAGLTGFYNAPRQSQWSPGTFLRIDPSTYDTGQYGDQLDYVTPSGQLQRVSTTQAKAMGWDGDLSKMNTLPFSQAAQLENAPPQYLPQQTLQGLQAYQQLNTNAQTAALQQAQATGMYSAPSQIYAPGTNAMGGKFQDLDQATQQAYFQSNGGDWTAAMNKWVADSNAAGKAATEAAGGTWNPNPQGTPTETMAAQQQYFNEAQQLAQTYGQYYAPGAPGQAGQAGVNGPQAGQQTLAGQQQYWQQGFQQEQFQQSAAQQYLQLLSQLQGPADYGQYLKVLGATPGGIQSLVGAAAGQFVPGTGVTGAAPQQQTLQNLINAATGAYSQGGQGQNPNGVGYLQGTAAFNPTQMPGYQPWMNQTLNQQMGGQQANGQMQSGQWTGGGQQYAPTDQPFSASGLPSGLMRNQVNTGMQLGGGQGQANQTYGYLQNAASGGAGAGYGAGAAGPGLMQNQVNTGVQLGGGSGGGSASPGGMNYNDFLAQAQGLPPPSQLSPQAFNNMLPSQQQMLGSMYSNLGYAKGDINAMYQQSLPKYAAGSSSGSFRLV